jgi:hypothetical protein
MDKPSAREKNQSRDATRDRPVDEFSGHGNPASDRNLGEREDETSRPQPAQPPRQGEKQAPHSEPGHPPDRDPGDIDPEHMGQRVEQQPIGPTKR